MLRGEAIGLVGRKTAGAAARNDTRMMLSRVACFLEGQSARGM